MNPSEEALWSLAEAQFGYFTRQQALALGMTPPMMRARLVRGAWRPIRPGIYVLAGHPRSRLGLLAVACEALGAVVSHESAAEIHELPLIARGLSVVTVGSRRRHEFEGVRVHQSIDMTSLDLMVRRNLHLTTVECTVFDLAAVIRPSRLDRLMDRCLSDGTCTVSRLWEVLQRLGRRGKPGTAAMRAALATRDVDYVATESELEFRFAELLAESGFPPPVRQLKLHWRIASESRVDFAYELERAIFELDGRRWHSTADSFDSDRRRDNLAQLAGWRVYRITWSMLVDRPHEVRSLVSEALSLSQSA